MIGKDEMLNFVIEREPLTRELLLLINVIIDKHVDYDNQCWAEIMVLRQEKMW